MRRGLGVGIVIGVLSTSCAAASPRDTTPAGGGVESAPRITTTSVASPSPPRSTATPSTTVGPTVTTVTPTTTTSTLAPIDRSPEAAAGRIIADVSTLVGFGPRVEGSAAEAAAGDWIAQRLRELTGTVETMRVELPEGRSSRNLWVTFGDPASGNWTLLGAHYDSITGSPGADDNASGTAIVLELARRLHESPPGSGAVTIMLFGAEEVFPGLAREDHHYGSRQWVGARIDLGLPLPDRMVSVDMVGTGAELYAVAYSGTSVEAVDVLVAAADDAGLLVGRLERGDISDHEPFALAGVPAAMLWRPSNPNYHGPGDAAVDPPRMLDVLTIVEQLVDRIHG